MIDKTLSLLKHFLPYLVLGGAIITLGLLKNYSLESIGKMLLILLLGYLVAWSLFVLTDVGFLRSIRKKQNEQIESFQKIIDHFNNVSGILPQFNTEIVPQIKGSSKDIKDSSEHINSTSDKLAEILQIRQLINRFVLFQGTTDYQKALMRAVEDPPIHEIRFMGTLIGASNQLYDPLIEHLEFNSKINHIKLIASKKKEGINDFRMYAINFCLKLANSILTSQSAGMIKLRAELNSKNSPLTISVRYLSIDIFASSLILGDKLFILAPSYGIEDHEQVKNFNFGLIVPKEDSTSTSQVFGNDIIKRQTNIFDETFGSKADDVWYVKSDKIIVDKAIWKIGKDDVIDFSSPSTLLFEITKEQIETSLNYIHNNCSLISFTKN